MSGWHSGWRLWLLIVAVISTTLVVTWAAGGMRDNGENDPVDIPCSVGLGSC